VSGRQSAGRCQISWGIFLAQSWVVTNPHRIVYTGVAESTART